MTDKFTDDEIIKALELCFTPKGTSYTCAKCPFRKIKLCKIERDRAALDLLHRQKAEIERLKNSRDRWKQIATDFDKASRETEKEIERLYKEIERISKMTVETNVKEMTEE